MHRQPFELAEMKRQPTISLAGVDDSDQHVESSDQVGVQKAFSQSCRVDFLVEFQH